MSETAAKKDVQKLQRTIVDALEDIKAQDIRVFNTEHLSPLFERVVVASGTSNRQTKALAASVRDKLRDAGFGKPRIEGEENGEWIIVDCGPAVVHVMQPAIRQYYNLEEIWGDKPVRLKGPDARAAGAQRKSAAMGEPEAPAKKPAAKKASAKAAPAKKAPAKAPVKAAAAKKAVAKKAPVKKPAAKTASRKTAAALPVQVVNKPKAPAKTAAKSSARPAAKSAGKPAPAKKAVAKKAPAKKAAIPRASR
ncbi:ribosome silencing factor [Ottowia sp. GY511]|uniref:Ribosomal silencing factor RsfS n=1 Tax=Ottowia flava TaxID=2675430 RepID=A0ABW4KPE8_9BURK|nr:ribosome silencing factor [Ottowia sp. GY511]TXK27818.1 ribosome silencing factor [Ottowia sp. GY511]